jgi:hypothetical protein
MSNAVDPLEGTALTRAAAAVNCLGCAVKRRGSSAKRLAGGGFLGVRMSGEEGGHGTAMASIEPIGVAIGR